MVEQSVPERQVLMLALKAGRILLENGAEVFRAEDTVCRICRYYGFQSASVFVLSNGIFLTCGDEKEPQFARVLQIPVNHVNLRRVAEVNELSRRIEQGRYTLNEIRAELERIEILAPVDRRIQVLVAGVCGACFSHVYGGGWQEALCTAVTGVLLYAYLLYLGKPHFSKIVCYILGSAWVSFLNILFYTVGFANHLDAMMVGSLILMVPGVAFTNGIRDVAVGDYISGSVRLLDALLIFFCIAIGVGFVFSVYSAMTGGVLL